MYQIGDYIIYGHTGVCKIINITTLDLPELDNNTLYYVLEPLNHDGKIYSPVNNTAVLIRPIITKEQAEQLIDSIPSMETKGFYTSALRELTSHYNSLIQTLDCADLLQLTMSVYAKKQDLESQKRKVGVIDERFMKQAEELLFSELSVALKIPLNTVPDYIASRVGGLMNGTELSIS